MSTQANLTTALSEIDCARDIVEFSTVVVARDKQLRKADHPVFLQKAALEFQSRFLPNFEESIRAGRSWGYATTCNAVSRKAGGQVGRDVCERIASRVSLLDHALIGKIGIRALSIFAASFGRHSNRAECRKGAIRIAKFCREESRPLQELNNLSLAALINGFSKWPEEADFRQAAVAIAGDVIRRAGRHHQLSDFTQQGLVSLVNGFSKWPDEAASRQAAATLALEILHRSGRLCEFPQQGLAILVNGFSKWPEELACGQVTIAIAGEVLRRVARFHEFGEQDLANLVNGFSKWPDEAVSRQATIAIASELLHRADQLPHYSQQGLANLVNGFCKWPEDATCRKAAIAIAGEVLWRAVQLPDLTQQGLANLVNGFSKWPEEPAFRRAAVALAREVLRRATQLYDFSQQGLANLVNGFQQLAGGAAVWSSDRCARGRGPSPCRPQDGTLRLHCPGSQGPGDRFQ
ncbi:hypothetical protein QIH80_35085 [Bradyrhizobium elkanii]|nr:hypothetical protein QIH80_35085 [Bradyrhizobium elkanii]